MYSFLRNLIPLVFCVAIPFIAPAQITKNEFGKNRLQYKVFNWRYYSTNNLDIYFYDDGQKLAKNTAQFLEDEYVRMTDLLGYQPYSKTKVFLYNSIADLQQSNVGVNENKFSVGGQTNFVKSHVEVAFPGTLEGFKEELVYEISHMLLMDMMFGGSLTDIFQNTYLMTLPDWFIDGAARYVAYGWGIEMDDYMRDQLKDGKMPKLNKIEGSDAALVGQSIWNYIAEKYGRSSLSHILNYTRIIRNEETAIANTLGIPFKYFLVEWRSYYQEMVNDIQASYQTPSEEQIVEGRNTGKGLHNSVAISPNGKYLAFTENYRGRYRIMLQDLETNKVRTVFRKGYRVVDQETDNTVPLVSWQNDENLGIIGIEKGLYTLYIYNLESENYSSQVFNKISQVNDFGFSSNGKVVVMSAEKEGQNDIYLYSISRKSLRAITNDLYDDVFPTFMPGSNDILFSSNRKSDTLDTSGADFNDISENYNLFLFNVDTTTNVLTRVTNTISKDIQPKVAPNGTIYYLSDQKGVYNIFRYNMQDSLYKQITAFNTSIRDYSIDFQNNTLAYIALYDGNERVFVEKNFDFNKENFTVPTKRQSTVQARYVFKNLKNKGAGVNAPIPDVPAEQENTAPDSATVMAPELIPPDTLDVSDTLSLSSENDTLSSEILPVESVEEDTRPINTDNYVFDAEVNPTPDQAPAPQEQSFLSTYRKLRRRNTLQGPFTLEPRFMVSSLITSWFIDPLRSSIGGSWTSGVGFILEGQMNDVLENHKIYGGVMAMTDIKSGDIFLEYEFLKYLLDFNVRLDRRVVMQPFIEQPQEKFKYILNKVEVVASLPLNVSTRIAAGPILGNSRFLAITNNSLLSYTGSSAPTDTKTFYGGGKVELVYDNTIVKGFNLYNGTLAKAEYSHMAGIGDSEMGFGKFTLEAKNYFPISRDFILATRGYAGSFIGSSPPNFILGGVDNWLFNKTEDSEVNDPFYGNPDKPETENRNLLFHEFVTPVRGFNYNAYNGKNVLLFNAELRFPLIKYFYRGPISSNFFRNLQVVGFYDIGSSWTGTPPFLRNNSINTVPKPNPQSPFRAVIQNYKNPWLSSFGFGARTVLLGYYFKFDVAYPMEDYKVSDPRFHLSFGYDF